MDKDTFINVTEVLSKKQINFKLENYIADGLIEVQGLIVKDKNELDKIISVLNHHSADDFKIKRSKLWFLDEQKEALILKFKEKIVITIPEFEKLSVTNYA